MTFQAPLLLGLLAVVPLVAAVYALQQRRARKFAVRYTNVDLLIAVAGRSWTRHLPALLALLALAALLIALARPQRTVAAERREATVMLVFDTSGSMLATDVHAVAPGRRAGRRATRSSRRCRTSSGSASSASGRPPSSWLSRPPTTRG